MNESLLDAIATTRRMVAEFEAVEAGLYAMALDEALRSAAPGSGSDMPVRAVAAEIGAATRMSDVTVQRRLSDAFTLTTRFAATYAAFSAGRISSAHVAAIVAAGTRIDDDAARGVYEEMVVAVAERESAGRVRGIARRLAERVLPRPLHERHHDAAAQRDVWVTDLDDGMAELRALLPAALAHGIVDRLTRMALALRHAPRDGESRDDGDPDADSETAAEAVPDTPGAQTVFPTPDPSGAALSDAATAASAVVSTFDRSTHQVRADLFADMLLTGAPSLCEGVDGLGAITAEVLVTVPALALAGVSGVDGESPAPAMLDGVAPIDLGTARRLVGSASGWDRVLTHPITGAVLAVDRYRPSADLRRFLRATDQRCRFPCCGRPAGQCDADHLHEAARGGPTAQHNLASECRRHHVVRHAAGWRVAKTRDGTVLWTSPTGRVYPDHPPGVVFRPAGSANGGGDLLGAPF